MDNKRVNEIAQRIKEILDEEDCYLDCHDDIDNPYIVVRDATNPDLESDELL